MSRPSAPTRRRFSAVTLVLVAFVALGAPAIAHAQDGYITLRDGRQVLVFDPATPTDTTNRVSFVGRPNGVAVSPDGATVYVIEDASVRVISGGVLVPAPIGLNGAPEQLAVSPDGSKVYVTNFGNNSKVHIINVAAGNAVSVVNFNAGDGAWGIAMAATSGGDFAYVSLGGTSSTANVVKVFDISSGTIVATVPVGAAPRGVAASPLGDRVYVANSTDDTVSVIDTATNAVLATIPVGDAPQELTVSADGALVYVSLRSAGAVDVIDTASNAVVKTVALGGPGQELYGISFSADGAFVVVAHFGTDRISVIDPAAGDTFVTTGPPDVLDAPRYVAFRPLTPVFPDTPPVFNLPLCGADIDAVLDSELSFGLSVVDDHGALVTMSESPATGGELDPLLPSALATVVESTFRWTPGGDDAGDYTLEFAAEDGANAPVSCAVTIHVPEPAEPPAPDDTQFTDFRLLLANVNTRGHFADSFWFNGRFAVDLENGDGIAPDEEGVTISIEGTEWAIPAGEFNRRLRGRLFLYRGVIDGTWLRVQITPRGRPGNGQYNINVTGWRGDLSGADNPLQMCVTIGDDYGCAERRGWIR